MSSISAMDNHEELLMVRVDRQSTILHVVYHNKKFSKSAKEMIGRTFKNIVVKQNICEQCEAHLKESFLNFTREVFQLTLGGRYYEISYLPEQSVMGQAETALVIVRDITKEEKLKAELHISQVKLKLAQQISMLGYFECDMMNNTRYWSEQLYKNFNLVPQETPPSIECWLNKIHPQDVERVRGRLAQKPTEDIVDMEYRIIKNDGSIRWIYNVIQFVFDEKGDILRQFGIVQDITKRKIVEIELQDLTGQLQTANKLLAASQTGIKMAGEIAKVGYFEWDKRNNYVYWSDQQYRNLGYVPEEVTPSVELFRSQIVLEDWELVQGAVTELSEKSYAERQFRINKANGTIGWLYSRVNVISNEQGKPVKIFGITQDITEQKAAEKRIHRAEQELAVTNELYSRSMYLNRLLANEYSEEYISKALHEFGIEARAAYCCFLIQLSDKTDRIEEEMTVSPMVKKQEVLIWLAKKEWGIVWRYKRNIVVLAPLSADMTDKKESQIQAANTFIAELKKEFSNVCVKIGISGTPKSSLNLRISYQKAYRAVSIAALMNGSAAIHSDDIGLYEVAFQLLEDKNTCDMVQNTIGRLAAYDKDKGSSLLATLECILECGSLKAVAQRLFIHHNTVIWRKRKIEDFLEMFLDSLETKMLLMLYLKIWKLKKIM